MALAVGAQDSGDPTEKKVPPAQARVARDGSMDEPGKQRPTTFTLAISVAGLIAAAGVAVLEAPNGNWMIPLLVVLLAFSLFSDLTAVSTNSRVKISGSFLALVLAMVFLGGAAAALIGVVTITVGWLRWRDAGHYFLNNLLTYAVFPLVGGIAFDAATDWASLGPSDAWFYALIFALFQVALTINFLMIAGYGSYVTRTPFSDKVRVLGAVLPSEIASGMMAVGVAYIYHEIGVAAIVLFGVVLITFQYLIGSLLLSQQRAEELERRTKQLASFQVGMLSALLRTLDLRDEMTARHSASVARYSRGIAKEAGLSQREQELVHVAGLMHDIGKFILPDKILKANVPLTEEDWMLIRRHPQQGARVVSAVDGYGPVAEIILAHHERIDGKGYPRGLKGDEIPELARIIAVADTYDVMTARDSYREPVSSFEAIHELQRVAGAQLDARYVRVFIELLQGKDFTFRHGEDVDFDVELALDEKIAVAAEPGADRYIAGGAKVS
ncbi:MAG: HD-GYP domain-containing protein [Actinomycetota bacterium]